MPLNHISFSYYSASGTNVPAPPVPIIVITSFLAVFKAYTAVVSLLEWSALTTIASAVAVPAHAPSRSKSSTKDTSYLLFPFSTPNVSPSVNLPAEVIDSVTTVCQFASTF